MCFVRSDNWCHFATGCFQLKNLQIDYTICRFCIILNHDINLLDLVADNP